MNRARGQAVANLGSAQGALAGSAAGFAGEQLGVAAGANVGASITAAFDAWAERSRRDRANAPTTTSTRGSSRAALANQDLLDV